jgi:hypothetical protein
MTRPMSRAALALAALLLASACSDTTTPPPPPPDAAVRGVVTDAQGRPVVGAAIVLQLESTFDPGGEAGRPRQALRFDLESDGHLHLWISAFCDHDTVSTLMDGQMPSGSYVVTWDGHDALGRYMPDGVYRMHAVWDGGEASLEFVMMGTGYGQLTPQQSIAADAFTNTQGAFRLETTCLPFDYTYPAYNESGQLTGQLAITRRVRVWAFLDGVVPAVSDWVTVDPEGGAAVSIVFADLR